MLQQTTIKMATRATHQSAGLNGNELACGKAVPILHDELARQVRDGPEQEQDGGGREQRTHGVDHAGHLTGIADKLAEQVGGQHEERCPWGVTNLKLVASSDKLRTVPEGSCRLNGGTIDKGGDEERQPSKDIVH